jgi:hypothetical protein
VKAARVPGRSIEDVRAHLIRPKTRPPRAWSRFGYDRRWWGHSARQEVSGSYWSVIRRPLPSLLFVLPMLVAYELGVLWLGGSSAEILRTGADSWIRQTLNTLGLTDHLLPPLAIVVALLGWQAAAPLDWRFSPLCLLGMLAESLVLAVALIGLSRLVDLGFARLESQQALLAAGPQHPYAPLVGFLGAAVYEEALFRLALIPCFYGALRLLHTPTLLASTFAVTASALLFSVAHHAGAPGEAFTWFAFIFRWLAGVFFAWVFVARGFGVAVGTHAAYDILVGWLGWHF